MLSLYAWELREAFLNFRLWRRLAGVDLRRRFKRSTLGVAWIALQQAVFAIAAGVLWSRLFGINPHSFIPFVACGLAVWGFITHGFMDGGQIFVRAEVYLKQMPLNRSIFVYRCMLVNMIILLVGLSVSFALVVLLLPETIGASTLLVIPGLLLLTAAVFATMQAIAFLALRFRDIPHILPPLFQLLFVLTPILYPIDVLEARGLAFAEFVNPLASLIEVVRSPLVEGEAAKAAHYAIALVYILFWQAVAFLVYRLWRNRIPYWL